MIASLEDIRQRITDGTIRAISLDTSVFDRHKLRLEDGLLRRVQQFRGSGVAVLLPDVIAGEVQAHLTREAADSQNALRKGLKSAAQAWQLDSDKVAAVSETIFGGETASAVAKRRMDSYVAAVGATVLEAEGHISIGEVLERYFSSSPPFAKKEDKKNEFPDAFSLLTLESWAEKNEAHVLVVSGDNDWNMYCESSQSLVVVPDLADALACFQRQAAIYACTRLSQQYVEGDPLQLIDRLQAAVNDQSWKIDFTADAHSQFRFDEDIAQANFHVVDLARTHEGLVFEAVDFSDGALIARAVIQTEAYVAFSFSFESWDGIDREYMPMGSGTASATEQVDVEVLITFAGRLPERAEIEEIEVLAQRIEVDLGEIAPDWMNDESSFVD